MNSEKKEYMVISLHCNWNHSLLLWLDIDFNHTLSPKFNFTLFAQQREFAVNGRNGTI